ncbi:MAG: Clp protease ClpS [Thermoleophilia bacterium]|nr:Clp protease ClpS [Thermoleophilia bacterium]
MSTASPGTGITLEHDSAIDHDRPWRVIVRNDDHNTFEGVAMAISRVVPKVDFHRGLELATEIHTSGAAVVWTGSKEVAELYHEQLASLGLTMARLEQAD